MFTFPFTMMSSADGAYVPARAVWLDGSADYLTWTPSGAGSSTSKGTISFWFKQTTDAFGASSPVLVAGADGNNYAGVLMTSAERWTTERYNSSSGSDAWAEQTNGLMRDTTAWQHVVVSHHHTDGTAADRIKIYINGTHEDGQGTPTNPGTSQALILGSAVLHSIGKLGSTGTYVQGYLADLVYLDGQAIQAGDIAITDLGETDSDTGIWVPKDPSGLTFGTNGFWLDFKVAPGTGNGAGTDVSGNNNHFTDNSMTAVQQVTDSPANDSDNDIGNYATLNPLGNSRGQHITGTLSAGNLTWASPSSSGGVFGTIVLDQTKEFYWEVTVNTTASVIFVGIASTNLDTPASMGSGTFATYRNNGTKNVDASGSAYGAAWSNGNVIGIHFDGPDDEITFYVNDSSQGAISFSAADQYFPFFNFGASSSASISVNFGQAAFSYTPKGGSVRLNTANLSSPTVTDPSAYFGTITHTGNTSSYPHDVTDSSINFTPDFGWSTSRAGSENRQIIDIVGGVDNYLISDDTTAYNTGSNITFIENGYRVASGGNDRWNKNGVGIVTWLMKAGGTGSANSDGNVTGGSTVSVASHNGFAIVKYGDCGGAAKTIGHGMGQAPDMIMVKAISGGSASSRNWRVYHKDLTSDYVLYLDLTDGQASEAASFGTIGTSTFGVDGGNGTSANGESHIAYCFARTQGLIGIGSYTGGGSDRPHVIIDDGGSGFKPAFILGKQYNADGQSWWIVDNARETFNSANGNMSFPNSLAAEANNSGNAVDFIANGFVPRSADTHLNAAGSTYVYLAFAESPFALNNRAK